LDGTGWNALYLGNHDQPRMVSRWGDDGDIYRVVSAKLLFTFLLTMRGTPSLYNGDELGMTNIRFSRIEEYRDIETKHIYQQIREKGGDTEAFLRDQQLTARDNGRTPFQWSADRNTGFTAGVPWMTINENYRVVNVAVQEEDADSVLAYVRRLVRLRRERKVLVYGEYRQLYAHELKIYAYLRSDGSEQVLVLLNFSGEERAFRWEGNPLKGEVLKGEVLEGEVLEGVGKVLINNYRELVREGEGVRLQPWQAVVIVI
jgi:oligo-1,6-glucosidase